MISFCTVRGSFRLEWQANEAKVRLARVVDVPCLLALEEIWTAVVPAAVETAGMDGL